MRHTDRRRPRPVLSHWIIGLVITYVVVLGATGTEMFLRPLSVAGCSDHCDYARLSAAVAGFLVTALLLTVLTAAATVALRRQRWWAILPLTLGIAGLTVAYLIADAASREALRGVLS